MFLVFSWMKYGVMQSVFIFILHRFPDFSAPDWTMLFMSPVFKPLIFVQQVFFVNCSCLWHAANTTPYIWTHLKLDWETLWCLENDQLGQPINHWVKNIITKTVLNWGFPLQTQKHVPFVDFSFMQCTLKVLRFMLRFTGINHGVFKHPISCAVYLH